MIRQLTLALASLRQKVKQGVVPQNHVDEQ